MIDVIIPAYNSHKTIEQTLFSIVYQDIADKVNVYIVDDASTHGYKEIVDYFSNFIKIKELRLEKNSGPGVARQYGIDSSNSKYIVFIDSDDVFSDPLSILNLYSEIENENCDVVISNFDEESEDEFITRSNDTIWLHGKIYRREYLEKEKIRFNNSRANEDNGFNQMIFLGNAKIKYIDKKTYIWRNNTSSITRKNDREYNLKGLSGYIYNINYALLHAEKNKYHKEKIGKLAFSALISMYHYYLQFQDSISDLIPKCKVTKRISDSNPLSDDDKLDIIESQYNTTINFDNRKFLLNPILTINDFFYMIDNTEEV